MIIKKHIIFVLLILIITSCEKEYTTTSVSRIIPRPQIVLNGSQYISFLKGEISEFADPGAKAYVNDNEIDVFVFEPEIDFEEPGVYLYQYFTQSLDGITATKNRVVSITYENVKNNDLSGKYTIVSLWSPKSSKVVRIDSTGVYNCSDILGFPGTEVEGTFVDIGRQELVLLPGESFLGNYGFSEGFHDRLNLIWEVNLLDAPNKGVSVPVVLYKED